MFTDGYYAQISRRKKLIASHEFGGQSGKLKIKVANLRGTLTFEKKEELINFAHGYESIQQQLRLNQTIVFFPSTGLKVLFFGSKVLSELLCALF